MVKLGLLVFGMVVLVTPAPASAMDWLTPSLENQRHNNLRKHQQKLKQQNAQSKPQTQPQSQTPAKQSISAAQRQAAWSRHKDEYRKVLLRDGQASADRWLDQQILAGR